MVGTLGMTFPFPLPPRRNEEPAPTWTGAGFAIAGEATPVLAYNIQASGWTDELTAFHESQAGDQHYIDKASRKNALDCLRRFCATPKPIIMDIGCSSGFMVRDIHQAMPE